MHNNLLQIFTVLHDFGELYFGALIVIGTRRFVVGETGQRG